MNSKSFFDLYRELLDKLRTLPGSVAKEHAIHRLEESAFWTSAALSGESSGIDFVTKPKPAAPKPSAS